MSKTKDHNHTGSCKKKPFKVTKSPDKSPRIKAPPVTTYSPTVPSSSSFPVNSSSSSLFPPARNDLTYQGILHSVLTNIMSVLLLSSSSRTFHNQDEISAMIQDQAEKTIEEDLSRMLRQVSVSGSDDDRENNL
jgi:hypothetical protein